MFLLVGAGCLVGACNSLNGVGDLAVVDGVGPGSGGAGTLDGGKRAEGGSSEHDGDEGGAGRDPDGGGPVILPNPTLAACGNNNRQICMPNANGWTPAFFGSSPLSGNGCPPEWPQKTTYQQSGGGKCGCTCAPSGGSCAGSVDRKGGPACAGPPTNFAVASGTCTDLNAMVSLPVAFTPHPSGPVPTTCTGTPDPQLRGPQPATVCTGAAPVAGAACDPSEMCVPKAGPLTGGFTCIVHDGDVACPSKLVFRTLVGASVTDNRSCGPTCTCNASGCSGGTLEAFNTAGCVGLIRKVDVDDSCNMGGAALTGASYRYTAASGCSVKQRPAISGAETYTSPRTLCCTLPF